MIMELPHIIKCNLNYLNHNFKHIDAAIFKCDICSIEVVYNCINKYHIWKHSYPWQDVVLDITCKEYIIKKLLE